MGWETDREARKAQRQSFLDLRRCQRGKICELPFPWSMDSAPWMTKLHDEISSNKILYPPCNNESIQINLSLIEHGIHIVSPLKCICYSTIKLVWVSCCSSFANWEYSSPVLGWFHRKGVAYTYTAAVFSWFCICRIGKKMDVTLCMMAGEDRHLHYSEMKYPLRLLPLSDPVIYTRKPQTPILPLISSLFIHPSYSLPPSSPQLEMSTETFLWGSCCCFG